LTKFQNRLQYFYAQGNGRHKDRKRLPAPGSYYTLSKTNRVKYPIDTIPLFYANKRNVCPFLSYLGKYAVNGGNSAPELGNFTANGGNSVLQLGKYTADLGNITLDLGKSTANGGNSAPQLDKYTADLGNVTPDLGAYALTRNKEKS
jgi:hypothetical protein